jgi:anti-sigma regulatory factor (Ser/Thr protein kinase)
VELTLRNSVAELAVLRDAVDRFAVEHGIAVKSLIALQVVLDEIVSNVIKYAWHDGEAHQLHIRLHTNGSVIEGEVSDDGQPYDPRNSPPPPSAAAGGRPRPGGLGVHMVKQLVDRFDYERVGGHNRLKLKMRYVSDALTQPENPDDRGT